MQTKKVLITALLYWLCNSSVLAIETPSVDPFARDLKIIATWFEGEFDNEEQRWFEKDRRTNIPEEHHHIRVHTIHTPVKLPEFGEHVFYVEEYRDNDPQNIIRQRLVIFSSDLKKNQIRMQQGFLKEPKKVLGAQNAVEKLMGLTAKDVVFLNECDVFWSRKADQFEGSMDVKTCVFGKGEDRRYSVHDLFLSKTKYWRVDETFRVKDDSLFIGHPLGEPVKMRRTKQFVCDVYFTNSDGTREELKGAKLHSQGGTVEVTRAEDGKEFTLLMRDKEYPFYATRPDFIYFSVREKGAQRSLVFTVADPLSRSLGVSLPKMTFYCYREGFEFREILQEL